MSRNFLRSPQSTSPEAGCLLGAPRRSPGGGTFRFGRRLLFLATPLEGDDGGLDEVDDGIWSIYFCDILIARCDERKYLIRSGPAAGESYS